MTPQPQRPPRLPAHLEPLVDEVRAAIRDVDRFTAKAQQARDRRNAAVVAAIAGGIRPCDLARSTGLTIPNIRAIRVALRA